MNTPGMIQISMAAAMTLGFKQGVFHRNARLHCLNLLLTNEAGCIANCGYCGLSRSRVKDSTFIRVAWPVYPLKEIVERAKNCSDIERVCVAMATYPDAAKDAISVIREVSTSTGYPVSVLIAPTLSERGDLCAMKEAGAVNAGVSIDAATEELFEQMRGNGVNGPHKWKKYWETTEQMIEVFGAGMGGVHLIVGLGETEREMTAAIQRADDLIAPTHLFSFFPEKGTKEEKRDQPGIDVYRRIQIARHLINNRISRQEQMTFDDSGRIMDFGIPEEKLEQLISCGLPFRTSGCPGKEACASACNRPYGNERPSESIRNFPFAPSASDILDIRSQLHRR